MENKSIVIGLFGCRVNNENMGCVALTYSVLSILKAIEKETESSFKYILFESVPDKRKISSMCDEIGISDDAISVYPSGYYTSWRKQIQMFFSNLKMKKGIKKCDVIIDVTEGDSFTDIYGDIRFNDRTAVKLLIEKMGVPLILGPQTYGPFKEEHKNMVKKTVTGAKLIISRDQQSADYLAEFTDRKVYVATDMAFFLPYNKQNIIDKTEKIKIGINISGLLIKEKNEGTVLHTPLKTNYDEYMVKLLDYLTNNSLYEVHLIPHVGDDGVKYYGDKYDNVIIHSKYYSPIEAKNTISQMDIFIGARMHATIAAFSSGVATIPTAYSRKFNGLFLNLGYNYVVDFCTMGTDEALNYTLECIDNIDKLKENVDKVEPVIKANKDEIMLLLSRGVLNK